MHQKYRECPSYRVRRGALVHGVSYPGVVISGHDTRARGPRRGEGRETETCDALVFKKE